MNANIRFKRGLKSNLPTSAPGGTPLWCTDTKELFMGTDDGVSKISVDAEEKYTLVTSISKTSTDSEYPSAKCVYDLLGNIAQLLSEV